jgi:hypothetical protein
LALCRSLLSPPPIIIFANDRLCQFQVLYGWFKLKDGFHVSFLCLLQLDIQSDFFLAHSSLSLLLANTTPFDRPVNAKATEKAKVHWHLQMQ